MCSEAQGNRGVSTKNVPYMYMTIARRSRRARQRHTRSLDHKRSIRPGPIRSAAESQVGRRMRGNDGHMYMVKMSANGVKKWVRG
jgi:hypothetical protein